MITNCEQRDLKQSKRKSLWSPRSPLIKQNKNNFVQEPGKKKIKTKAKNAGELIKWEIEVN